MYYIFKNELKRRFKNPVIWILILITIIVLYVNIERSHEANEFDAILSHTPGISVASDEEAFTEALKEYWYGKSYEDYITRSDYFISQSLYNTKLHNYEMDKKAYLDNDIRERNRLSAFGSLLSANEAANTKLNNSEFSKYIVQIANNDLWDKISDGISYKDIDFVNNETGGLYSTIQSIFHAKYYHYLYTNSIKPIETYEFNNLYVLYNWIINIVPLMLIIFSILLNYDLINRDVKEGSAKLLITQSISRWKYYLGKFFAGTIVILFTLMIPLLVSNIYLKTQTKSYPMNYPIVYDEQGLTSFKPSFNYKEKNYKIYERDQHVAFYTIPYSKMSDHHQFKTPLYQRNTELISFNKYIMLSFLFGLLFIMFMVAFIQLCSAIFNNTIVSILATTGIYCGFYFLFRPYLYEKHYNLCPFTMNNSARIVAGTHNVTMLTAFLILTLSTLLLLLIGIKYFKKKAI